MPSDQATKLLKALEHDCIRYTVDPQTQAMIIHSGADMESWGITELPEDLTVLGSLDASGCSVLPRHLVVDGHLFLYNLVATTWPTTLSVRENMRLDAPKDLVLPENFSTPGSLDLCRSLMTSLPKGLHVGQDLDISGTSIARLPEGLHVGGRIFPSGVLEDVLAFMNLHPDAVLTKGATCHEQLELREHLLIFPDLWTIMDGMPIGKQVGFHRLSQARYQLSFARSDP